MLNGVPLNLCPAKELGSFFDINIPGKQYSGDGHGQGWYSVAARRAGNSHHFAGALYRHHLMSR
jgi:hypothetical protein